MTTMTVLGARERLIKPGIAPKTARSKMTDASSQSPFTPPIARPSRMPTMWRMPTKAKWTKLS